MRRELWRQSVHLAYGVGFTLLTAWNAWIGITITLLFAIGILTYRKREFGVIRWFIERLEREERIAGFGSFTLSVGITSVILIFPENGVIAGIGVAVIDSIATLIGMFSDDEKKHLVPSLLGGLAFFIVATIAFSDVRVTHLAIAAFIGSVAEFLSTRTMLIDDNITVPWAIVIVLALL